MKVPARPAQRLWITCHRDTRVSFFNVKGTIVEAGLRPSGQVRTTAPITTYFTKSKKDRHREREREGERRRENWPPSFSFNSVSPEHHRHHNNLSLGAADPIKHLPGRRSDLTGKEPKVFR